jgi:hypothetical protein
VRDVRPVNDQTINDEPNAPFPAMGASGNGVVLAEHFGVPVEQIDERRRDLAVARAVRAGQRDR